MVEAMDCVGCHTDGFGSQKMEDPAVFACTCGRCPP
jgi:hypothetical protein